MDIDFKEKQNLVNKYIENEMKEKHIPGIAVAIIGDNDNVFTNGYGYSNLEYKIPVSIDSVFEICSITKQFTVASVMLLVEEGILSLDKPITTYLFELSPKWNDITIRHLLTATSGLKDYLNDVYEQDVPIKGSNQKIIQFIINQELNFNPGEQWEYNNTGFVILSQIIEKISGLNLHEFLEMYFFKPLGCNIAINNLSEIIYNRVTGYEFENNKWVNRQPTYTGKMSCGDGELLATIEDMAKWSVIWSSNKYLKLSSRQLIWTPAKLNSGKDAMTPINTNYGFGCFIEKSIENARYWIPGSGEGFSTSLMYFPKDKLTIIILTNLGEFLVADSITLGIKKILS